MTFALSQKIARDRDQKGNTTAKVRGRMHRIMPANDKARETSHLKHFAIYSHNRRPDLKSNLHHVVHFRHFYGTFGMLAVLVMVSTAIFAVEVFFGPKKNKTRNKPA